MKKFLLLLVAAWLGTQAGRSQSQLVDCSCLATQAVLQTNACQAVIPDLCQFTQCWLSPTPLQCSQTPPPGGIVGPGTHPITVTFNDPFSGSSANCLVNFVVTAPPGGCGGCTNLENFLTLFSGRNSSGNLLPAGATDTQFDLSGPSAPPQPVVIAPPHSAWLPNSTSSQWIGPGAGASANAPAGLYAYTNRFYLCSTLDATITGRWTCDDGGAIHLNGVTTGNDINTAGAYASWHPVSITSGFLVGWNTLVFYVTNFGGPTGLRLELSGTNCADCCACTNAYDFLPVTIPGEWLRQENVDCPGARP